MRIVLFPLIQPGKQVESAFSPTEAQGRMAA